MAKLNYQFADGHFEEINVTEEFKRDYELDFTLIADFEEEGHGYPTFYDIPSDIKQAFEEKTGFIQIRNAQKYILTKLVITNIGQAGAVDVLLEINNRRSLVPFSMVKEANKIIYVLFCLDEHFIGEKEIRFSFRYNDIQGNTKYNQQFIFSIGRNDDDFVYTAQGPSISAPSIE